MFNPLRSQLFANISHVGGKDVLHLAAPRLVWAESMKRMVQLI